MYANSSEYYHKSFRRVSYATKKFSNETKGELYMEESPLKWSDIPNEEKEELISHLTDNLKILRAKGSFTQENVANAIGISRQTYNAIECKKTEMTWSVYLSLIFLFSSLKETNQLLKILQIYPNSYMQSKEENRL